MARIFLKERGGGGEGEGEGGGGYLATLHNTSQETECTCTNLRHVQIVYFRHIYILNIIMTYLNQELYLLLLPIIKGFLHHS